MALGQQLATSGESTCLLTSDRALHCWGHNGTGQLGPSTHVSKSPSAVQNTAVTGAAEIVGGKGFFCAIVGDGQVVCWGSNTSAQLGQSKWGPKEFDPSPRRVEGLEDVVQLAAGNAHVCALMSGGAVAYWGHGGMGQLGDGFKGTASGSPVAINGLTDVKRLFAGQSATCALTGGGQLHCWGDNNNGLLGDGSSSARSGAYQISALSAVKSSGLTISSGCALLGAGSVWCWGRKAFHVESEKVVPPVQHHADANSTNLAAGDAHYCTWREDGVPSCWGRNRTNQLGAEPAKSNEETDQVRAVAGVSGVTQMALGRGHSCALTRSGQVTCWGANSWGQLGDGGYQQRTSAAPVKGLP